MIRLKIFIPAIVLICSFFVFTGCTKNAPRTFVEMDSDSGVIKKFNFLPGTYWIYQDAINGRVDSFYVRSNRYEAQSETYVINNYHLITVAQQNIDGTNRGDSALWIFSNQANRIYLDYCYTTNEYGWKNQIQFAPLYIYPFAVGNLLARYDSGYVTQVDSMYVVNSLPFFNVAQVYHESNANPATSGTNITRLTDWFFVNDSVGLISMHISHPDHNKEHVWQLLRYEIVRPQY